VENGFSGQTAASRLVLYNLPALYGLLSKTEKDAFHDLVKQPADVSGNNPLKSRIFCAEMGKIFRPL
jgi:hypothetical protein